MPNANYVKGRRKEYKIVKEEREEGRIAQRTAGSHSPFDVISIDVRMKCIRLIQSKPDSMSQNEISRLIREHCDIDGNFLVLFEIR